MFVKTSHKYTPVTRHLLFYFIFIRVLKIGSIHLRVFINSSYKYTPITQNCILFVLSVIVYVDLLLKIELLVEFLLKMG